MNRNLILYIFLIITLPSSVMCAGGSQEPEKNVQQEELIVPEGTIIPIVLTAYLNTRNSQVGDRVYADTTYPIWIQQQLVIPKGSTIRGTVTEVTRPGRFSGKGKLAIRFDDILLPNGIRHDLAASFRGIHGPGNEKIDRKSETVDAGGEGASAADIGTVVGTSAQGSIIGAVAGRSGTGAILGAGAGAVGGLVTVLFTKNRHLVINPGTQFDLELKRPLKFYYNEIMFTDSELNSVQQRARPSAPPRNRQTPNWGGRGPWPY